MEEIKTEDLDKVNCKKYKYLDECGNIIKAMEKTDDGRWVDTTTIEQLKVEIAKEEKSLNKLNQEE